jgi:hypothetical protein
VTQICRTHGSAYFPRAGTGLRCHRRTWPGGDSGRDPLQVKEITMSSKFETHKSTRQGRDTTLTRRRQRMLKRRTGTGIEVLAAEIIVKQGGVR